MIPSLRDWRTGTHAAGRARSAELRALDDAIDAYHRFPSDDARTRVGTAWRRWKKKHTSVFTSFVDNDRNAAGLFEILDEEFRTAGAARPRGALSRLGLDIEPTLPTGFRNVGAQAAATRIDKALAEAQAIVRLTAHRIAANDAGVQEFRRLWFGTTPQADIARRFDELNDYIACRLVGGLRRLKIAFHINPENDQSIAHVKTGQNIRDTIWFSGGFFDDDKVVADVGLVGRPEPVLPHVQATLKAAREHAVLQDELNRWNQISSWIATSHDPTLREAVEAHHARVAARWNRDRGPKPVLADWLKLCTDARLKLDAGPRDASTVIEAARQRLDKAKQQIEQSPAAGPHGFKASAGGVVIHEMTHLLFNTEDERVEGFAGAEKRSYGPIRCATLAVLAPAKACNNADSYRLFAECCVAE